MSDLVAIDLPGGTPFLRALRRAWDDGHAVLPVDQRLSPPARRALLEHMAPAWVVDADGRSAQPDGRPVEAGDALVMATSGTTGTPKGVILTHDALTASARATSARLGVEPDRHRWLACLPLNHIGGMAVVARALIIGTGLELLAGFEHDAVVDRSGPDVFVSLVPTTLARVGPDRFHTVVLGGSSPPGGLAANVVTTYGLTETGSGVVYDGRPLDEVELDIVDGEVRVRGPMLLRGYRDGSEAVDGDGWFATGDAGAMDEAGLLQVRGRIAELIITGGENVWPAPVEAILRAHPGVADVAVAGRPDPEWGQRVVAWIVPSPTTPTPALADLRRLVTEQLAAYAAPRQLLVVDHLPRTAIGKIQRSLLPGPEPSSPGSRRRQPG